MQNSTQIEYFIRTKATYSNSNLANQDLKEFFREGSYEVGYYMPQPKYKSWVPTWLIRFITKR